MWYKYKEINLFTGADIFVESVITALCLLSEFREMKTIKGGASAKCCKKAGRFPTSDSEGWRPRIQEHTISPSALKPVL